MDEIIELAARLGKQIGSDPRIKAFVRARRALVEASDERRLLTEYDDQHRKIAHLEASGRPVEPEDKRTLVFLHDRIVSSPILGEFLKSQMDYVDVIGAVSRVIEEEALRVEDS